MTLSLFDPLWCLLSDLIFLPLSEFLPEILLVLKTMSTWEVWVGVHDSQSWCSSSSLSYLDACCFSLFLLFGLCRYKIPSLSSCLRILGFYKSFLGSSFLINILTRKLPLASLNGQYFFIKGLLYSKIFRFLTWPEGNGVFVSLYVDPILFYL